MKVGKGEIIGGRGKEDIIWSYIVEAIAAASVGGFDACLYVLSVCACGKGRHLWICGFLSSWRTSTGIFFVVERFKLCTLFGEKVFY